MRIIKETITCLKCNHVFTFEYPEKHDKIGINCPKCSAHHSLAKTKGKAGLITGIVIGVIVIIGMIMLVWKHCVIDASPIC